MIEKQKKENDLIELIDAAFNWPISNAVRAELQSFKTQIEAGTLHPDDRKYAIKLCQWILDSPPNRVTGSSAVFGVTALLGRGFIIGVWLLGVLLIYGVVIIIFRYAFGVELWNPFH
jgi:hypothetical protein